MRTKFVRSLMFIALSTTALPSLQASWNYEQPPAHRPQTNKRTFDDIYQTPPSTGNTFLSTTYSLASSGLSSLGSFLRTSFGFTSQEDARDTVPTRAQGSSLLFQADVQNYFTHNQEQESQRVLRAPRHHLIDSFPDRYPQAHVYQSNSFTQGYPPSNGQGFADESFHYQPSSFLESSNFASQNSILLPQSLPYGGVSRTSTSTSHAPLLIIDDNDDHAPQGNTPERPKKRQKKNNTIILDLTTPTFETDEEDILILPSGPFSSVQQQAHSHLIQIDEDLPDMIVEEKAQPSRQGSGLIVDIDDPESLQKALRTYSIERRYNQMEPIYMEWYKELSIESGLKRAYADKKIYDEWGSDDPEKLRQIEYQTKSARAKLIELARTNPIYTILKSRGFNDKEIRYARDQRFLNFYEK
ncbi:hypothetical protein [Candidatus Nucleicultrix amoebiphila]|uniref:Uncharacterized protein n=1 Tax=Candidatus Nucleicultrix amoebiphila FS5 TaxID=1414854 RepID=A0A1W6N598_9PROT|nr:hypothetical protein [Candidatus Nucleicultrix amoebiphila]ARN85027.1 hypothetical protein GQ61_06675 [Candidatus Nucleicultrix amoebiphila FS5]